MARPSFILLQRAAWVDRRIDDLQRRDASALALLRLKALRLTLETRLKGLSLGRRSSGDGFAFGAS